MNKTSPKTSKNGMLESLKQSSLEKLLHNTKQKIKLKKKMKEVFVPNQYVTLQPREDFEIEQPRIYIPEQQKLERINHFFKNFSKKNIKQNEDKNRSSKTSSIKTISTMKNSLLELEDNLSKTIKKAKNLNLNKRNLTTKKILKRFSFNENDNSLIKKKKKKKRTREKMIEFNSLSIEESGNDSIDIEKVSYLTIKENNKNLEKNKEIFDLLKDPSLNKSRLSLDQEQEMKEKKKKRNRSNQTSPIKYTNKDLSTNKYNIEKNEKKSNDLKNFVTNVPLNCKIKNFTQIFLKYNNKILLKYIIKFFFS